MWCYDIGERLGVYKLTDALVYRWWIGELDFGDPDLTAQLYRNYKLRDERPSQAERFLLYKRILNIGNAPVGDRVVVNEDFPQPVADADGGGGDLHRQVASRRSATTRSTARASSRRSRRSQYNLTQRMAGMALTQVTEMYNQLTQTDRGQRRPRRPRHDAPPRGRSVSCPRAGGATSGR